MGLFPSVRLSHLRPKIRRFASPCLSLMASHGINDMCTVEATFKSEQSAGVGVQRHLLRGLSWLGLPGGSCGIMRGRRSCVLLFSSCEAALGKAWRLCRMVICAQPFPCGATSAFFQGQEA